MTISGTSQAFGSAEMSVTEGLSAGTISVSAKGQKNAPIMRNGQKAFWTFSNPATAIFHPSAYKGATGSAESTRLSLCLNVEDTTLQQARDLDKWAVEYALEHSEAFFGRKMSRDQVVDRYNAIEKKSDKYPNYIKIKVTIDPNDRNAPSYWTMDKVKRNAPENWQQASLTCHARIVGFWLVSNSFGLSIQLQDAMVDEYSCSCPF